MGTKKKKEKGEEKESINQHHHNDAYPHLRAMNHLSQAPQRSAPKGTKSACAKGRLERDNTTNDSIAKIQLHAKKLVSQASEIGLGVFSKATAFLEGRAESVVTAYEEHVPRGVWVRVARGGQVDEEDLRVRLEIVVSMMVARVLSRRNLLRTSNPTSALQQPLRVLCSRTRITAIL